MEPGCGAIRKRAPPEQRPEQALQSRLEPGHRETERVPDLENQRGYPSHSPRGPRHLCTVTFNAPPLPLLVIHAKVKRSPGHRGLEGKSDVGIQNHSAARLPKVACRQVTRKCKVGMPGAHAGRAPRRRRSLFVFQRLDFKTRGIKLKFYFRKGCTVVPPTSMERTGTGRGTWGAPVLGPRFLLCRLRFLSPDVSSARSLSCPACHPVELLVPWPSAWPHGPGG